MSSRLQQRIWRPQNERQPRTRDQMFSSPIVVAAMKEVDRMNEELRQWRERRKGKRIEHIEAESRLTFWK